MQLQIEGIECLTLIGCNHRERQVKQLVEIELILNFTNLPKTDDIDATVNYSTVCGLVKQLVEQSDFMLLESLVQYLGAKLLETFKLLASVTLRIGKPEIYGQKARKIFVEHTELRQHRVVLALGSNLNNPKQQLSSAIEFLSEIIHDIRIAPFYRSSPQGYTEQQDFYNTCISGLCSLEALALFRKTKAIEKLMGKQELFINGPRVIDIDIIFFADQIHQELFLQIPHSEAHKRDFVLLPLAKIEPQWQHPKLGVTVEQLLAKCEQTSILLQDI